MGLFTSLLKDSMGETVDGANLGKIFQANRLIKTKIVSQMLGILDIQRPDLSLCDLNNTSSILAFIARENLDCAFHCEPDTDGKRVNELCNIALGKIDHKKHIYLSLHHEAEAAMQEKLAHDILPYYEVFLRDIPQDKGEQEILIAQFKEFFIQARNDHK